MPDIPPCLVSLLLSMFLVAAFGLLLTRIADIETLRRELSSWESDRNSADSKIVWQFQTKDARVKLASLYPKIVEC